ncbi:MAG TPA: hypothetical protein DEB06_00045 [Phycisphaerales bacterium]|nr:hypothetical protein [Phycisphaerales bacterium]
MRRASIDETLTRHSIDGFEFPLGVHPVEPMKPVPGYTVQFEAADGGGTGPDIGYGAAFEDWEEWPDRFVYDILVSASRVRSLCRVLFAMLPGRVFPILDHLGHDAYRDIDPYLAYAPVGIEKFYEGVGDAGDWLFEDGMVGFGAMSLDPFFYVFVDEHKVVTVRVEAGMKDRLERALGSFDLAPVEEIKAADAAEHEHRTVLPAPEQKPEAPTSDELIERLRDLWELQLNIDPATNLDHEGHELGITPWQCVARCSDDEAESDVYAEVVLTAGNLQNAERLAAKAAAEASGPKREWDSIDIIRADRVPPEQVREWLGRDPGDATRAEGVLDVRWLSDEMDAPGVPGE